MIKQLLAGCVAVAVLLVGVSSMMAKEKGKGKPHKTPAEIMQKLDKDGNSALTLIEFVGKKDGEKAQAAKKRFQRLDKDSDGSVTLDEFKAGPKKGKKNK